MGIYKLFGIFGLLSINFNAIRNMAGEKFDMSLNSNILALNSPRKSVGGPYKVVYKNEQERWAIVAMDWEGQPCLGMRWFWGGGGNPFSNAKPIWLVIPDSLSNSVLNGLPLNFKFYSSVMDFLAGKIAGNQIL